MWISPLIESFSLYLRKQKLQHKGIRFRWRGIVTSSTCPKVLQTKPLIILCFCVLVYMTSKAQITKLEAIGAISSSLTMTNWCN